MSGQVMHGLVNAGPTSNGRWQFRCMCRDRFTAADEMTAADLFRDHLAEVDDAAGAER